MENNQNTLHSIKFRPDYSWPEDNAERDCPKCDKPMQLQKNLRDYYGNPWWCHFHQLAKNKLLSNVNLL